jgi:TRAP-type mannitol/chloroaromatic compound transport system substrate-binding protein
MTIPQKNSEVLEAWTSLKEKILSKFNRLKEDYKNNLKEAVKSALLSILSKAGYEFSEELKEYYKVKTIEDEIKIMTEIIGNRLDYLKKNEHFIFRGLGIEEVD